MRTLQLCRFPTERGPCQNPVKQPGGSCYRHAGKDRVAGARAMAASARAQQSRLRKQAMEQRAADRWAGGRRSETPMSDEQIVSVVGTMNRHGVRYIVIGGTASQLHGAPVERTYDIDLVPDRAARNLDALGAALREMNGRLWVGPEQPSGLPMTFDRVSLGNIAGFLNLVTDHGPVDITSVPDGTTGYPDLIRSVVIIRVGDEGVPVADLADVIRSKEAAGRTKDLEVLPRLHKFLRARPKERRAK